MAYRDAITREGFIRSPLWKFVMSGVSILNAMYSIPQTWKIWTTHQVSALSLSSLWMMFVVQAVFAFHGWLQRDKFLPISGGAAACVTTTILIGVYVYR